MDANEFLENFALQFDETEPEDITLATNFKDLDEWSSLTALSIIAMVDEQYNGKLSAEDFKNSATVGDIFELLKSRV